MNQKVLKTLEYYKIIERLTDCAASEPGKKMCRELTPSSDFNEIVQAQTDAAAGDIIQLIKIMSVGQKMVGRLAALHFYKADRQNCLPAHFSSPLPSKYISRFN